MDFHILGPIEALGDDDRPIALGGAKQRALLGMLLLHANQVVPSDRLIDELWPSERREDALRALQVAVSRLRKALESNAKGARDRTIATRAPGYELHVDPARLDAARFEALAEKGSRALAAGDAGTARQTLEEALALWRGPPLADIAYESFCQTEIARLEELRLTALEDRLGADLELGRHSELIGDLRALVGDQPLRERPRAHLMLALYRSGRQAEALEIFAEARSTLVEELGIEPSRQLRDLHQAILQQDPGLDFVAVREPATPAARTGFVGRGAELAELLAGLDDARGGRGRLFLLGGEPGIGKSRLADELITRARDEGVQVLVGRCWEAGGAPAYWPWLQALRSLIGQSEPEALRAQLGSGAGELVHVLPELREVVPDVAAPGPQDDEGARFRLFEAASHFLHSAAERRPLVLVLDDLHAADEPSLLLLRFVARQMGSSHLLVLCAFRDVDPALRDPLTSALAELVREPGAAEIKLRGMSVADVAEYIQVTTGREPEPRVVEAIHTETEGNPLFVTEVVRLLSAEEGIDDEAARLRIPSGVRSVISQRMRRLSDRCQDVLVLASVLGREFRIDALARLSGLSAPELLEVLDEAMTERVVGDAPGSGGRLRFGHALIRDTLYDELTSARRMQLHRDAASALEHVYSADPDPHLAELAHHLVAAAPAGAADEARVYARRAGDRAASQLAFEEAVRLYAMALPLVVDDSGRCELLVAQGEAQARSGDTPAAQRSFLEAVDLAERLQLPDQLARAALGYGGRVIWEVSRDDARHVALLERALAALGEEDSPVRVRLLARLAAGPLRDSSFDRARRVALATDALAMARRLNDEETLAYALTGYIAANHSPDFAPEQLELATEQIQVALAAGDLERVLEGREHRATALIEFGDLGGAQAEVAAMATTARALHQPAHDWLAGAYAALLALLEGRLSEAEDLIERARALGERAHGWNAAVSQGLQLYVLRRHQGRIGELEELVRSSVDEHPTYPIWHCVLAQLTALRGRTDEPRELLERALSNVPFDEEYLVSLSLLSEAAAIIGYGECAEALYELLGPYADRIAVSYPEISTGAVARYLGLLAMATGDWTSAERHFDHALELNERVGARPWHAYTTRDYAEMLEARRQDGDAERAQLLRSQAQTAFEELGMADPP
jgi:DNA-binding SARP family transcriptional activator